MHGMFGKVEAGEIPTRQELKIMLARNEAMIYISESVGEAREDKDWEEEEDRVQKSWSSLLNKIDETYGNPG